MRLRVLDLFCGAGGSAKGYHDGFTAAGFDVEITGVDIAPQPNYPYEFVQADAMTYPLDGFDFIHASPPCQAYSGMSRCRPGLTDTYADLVAATRTVLDGCGLPYVVENVVGSPLSSSSDLFGREGLLLCGRMFGLDLYRHRLFESNLSISTPHHPRHDRPASKAGHWRPGTVISVSGNVAPIQVAREAMGIAWMTRAELGEAIPPAYTAFLADQIVPALVRSAA